MSINNITFNLGQGNLGRSLPGQDYISGYLVYSNNVPTGFSASIVKEVFSIAQAESLGITNDYSDETKATAVLLAGATGSVGDTVTLTITEPNINSTTNPVTITYTRQSSDTTSILFASHIVSAI